MNHLPQKLQLIKDNAFHQFVGIRELKTFDGKGSLVFSVNDSVINPNGGLHGGILYAISDVCAYIGLLSLLKANKDAVTHDIQVSVMRAAKKGDLLEFESEVSKLGRNLAFINCRVSCGGKLIAEARITKSIINA